MFVVSAPCGPVRHQDPTGSIRPFGRAIVAASLAVIGSFPCALVAADYSISGFGTLGFTRSDKSFHYQRFIDDRGTLKRDSVAGIQIDASLTPTIGATLQALAAPSTRSDEHYEGTIAWAFTSWRPSNEWLVRLGKQRIPLYLYSQTYNVGVTYDFARLPTEMYSISPSNDFTGISVGRTWERDNGDWTIDGYWGKSDLDVRFWIRDGAPPLQPPGSLFRRLGLEGGGVVISRRKFEDTYRIGFSQVSVYERNASNVIPTTYPYVSVFPGVGYYQVNLALPGPGIQTISNYRYRTLTLGADVAIGSKYRLLSELARSFVTETLFSTQSTRGYIALQRKMGQWTPYVVYAFLRSSPGPVDLYDRVNSNKVPNVVPGAAQINASQRIGADAILVYDQHSVAIGTSYSLSTTSKIKAEWMRTRIGRVSSMVDAPPGSNIRNQNINVISLSYSVVF